jgi:hypothetical protein
VILDNIIGISKENTSTMAEQVKRFCRYQGIMCEYATDYGYCRITGCAKLHELYGIYKGGNLE